MREASRAYPSDMQSSSLHIVVNGTPQEVHLAERSVEALLAALALPAPRVAVERNGQLVVRAARATTRVEDGDVFEIVTLVGGG